ncbi:protein CLMP1-like [Daucus carota subsp. sativus]|uniref:protein CLMP1-like n=1 Tax=Daucus carota subsp. sativus TaxID=79200 RepID=UPI0030839D9A
MLFKLSPVECKLGMMDWNKNLGPALERLKLDGTSKAKISILLKYQCLNLDAVEGNKVALLHLKKYESLSLLAIKEETLKRTSGTSMCSHFHGPLQNFMRLTLFQVCLHLS